MDEYDADSDDEVLLRELKGVLRVDQFEWLVTRFETLCFAARVDASDLFAAATAAPPSVPQRSAASTRAGRDAVDGTQRRRAAATRNSSTPRAHRHGANSATTPALVRARRMSLSSSDTVSAPLCDVCNVPHNDDNDDDDASAGDTDRRMLQCHRCAVTLHCACAETVWPRLDASRLATFARFECPPCSSAVDAGDDNADAAQCCSMCNQGGGARIMWHVPPNTPSAVASLLVAALSTQSNNKKTAKQLQSSSTALEQLNSVKLWYVDKFFFKKKQT